MKRALNEMEQRNDEATEAEIRGMSFADARDCALRMSKGYSDLMRACEDLIDRAEVEGNYVEIERGTWRRFEAEVGYRA